MKINNNTYLISVVLKINELVHIKYSEYYHPVNATQKFAIIKISGQNGRVGKHGAGLFSQSHQNYN